MGPRDERRDCRRPNIISPSFSTRQVRLASGLVLFSFVATHLANHALGLVSLGAMEAGRGVFLTIWRSMPGTFALYGAFVVHFALALRAIYSRRAWRMPVGEFAQLAFGLLLPFLLIDHVLGTRVLHEVAGIRDSYARVIYNLWVVSPVGGVKQALVLVIAWSHGCLGLYFWLRQRSWFARYQPVFLAAAVLLPSLALLGFIDAGQTIARLAEKGGLDASVTAMPADGDGTALIDTVRTAAYSIFATLVGGLFVLRFLRYLRLRRNMVEIRYGAGQTVRVPRGFSVLEASRRYGIPHNSTCGGKGRCSTCRVRVIEGLDRLPPPTETERKTLARINAGKNVRLACQLRAMNDLTVIPLLSTAVTAAEVVPRLSVAPGREQEVVVLFCDIRGFTKLVEARLPFDVVFLLNRYFAVVGRAVEAEGGTLDKFVGDGVMALFGVTPSALDPCRGAFAAAVAIGEGIRELNQELADELRAPLRLAIGIHVGPAVVGAIGYGSAIGITAIGDTVNIASRLEGVAKELDAYLVASERTALRAGLDLSAKGKRRIDVRGRSVALNVVAFDDMHDLSRSLDDESEPLS
jgi:adenylate cyclase